MNESQLQRIEKDTKVAVYWPKYNRYYEAVVLEMGDSSKFLVRYVEDGFEEWVNASHDKFRIISGPDEQATEWSQITMTELLNAVEDSIEPSLSEK
jgi:hypothetical protein